MNGLISIPNNAGLGTGGVAPGAFLTEARANPVYNITTFTEVSQVLPYLQALSNQLAADCPAGSGVKNKTAPDTRTQTLLAEMIVAAGG
jgi:hypothetical protein